jgi:HlyD family secretion protein
LLLVAMTACAGEDAGEVPMVTVKKQKFERVVEAQGYLRPVQATPLTVPADTEMPLRITWLAADGVNVKKDEVVARFDDLELRARLADGETDRAVATAKRTKEALLLATASRDRARTTRAAGRELDLTRSFQRRDTAIFSRDQIIENEIDERLQQARAEHAQTSEKIDRRLGGNKLALIGVEARKAEESIRRARSGLKSLEIRSPHDGVFTLKRGWMGETLRVGDTVWRSQTVAELTQVQELEAELFVLEVEAAGLAAGRRAELVVEAQPDRTFPARVKRVETVAKRRQRQSPTQYFGVVLALDKTDPEQMKPGQTVRARLHLHEASALVVPRPALFDRDGRWIAYRRDGPGRFSPVPVKIGASTAGLCTIESGLAENDRVALRDPGRSAADLLTRPESSSRPSR